VSNNNLNNIAATNSIKVKVVSNGQLNREAEVNGVETKTEEKHLVVQEARKES